MARNVQFSQPIPAQCFGIEKPDGEGGEALGGGFPAIAAGQQFIFDGGQYAGLKNRIGEMMEIQLTYEYMNPIGIRRKRKEACVLSITHLEGMPSRTNAEQAIVDALKSNNVTTLHNIQKQLTVIGSALSQIAKEVKSPREENDA